MNSATPVEEPMEGILEDTPMDIDDHDVRLDPFSILVLCLSSECQDENSIRNRASYSWAPTMLLKVRYPNHLLFISHPGLWGELQGSKGIAPCVGNLTVLEGITKSVALLFK